MKVVFFTGTRCKDRPSWFLHWQRRIDNGKAGRAGTVCRVCKRSKKKEINMLEVQYVQYSQYSTAVQYNTAVLWRTKLSNEPAGVDAGRLLDNVACRILVPLYKAILIEVQIMFVRPPFVTYDVTLPGDNQQQPKEVLHDVLVCCELISLPKCTLHFMQFAT